MNGIQYKIGKPRSMEEIVEDIERETETYEQEGKTVVYFGIDNEVIGLIAIQDVPKDSSKEAVNYFKNENIHTIMITGDAERTGAAIGGQLDIDEVISNDITEDKGSNISDLVTDYPVCD